MLSHLTNWAILLDVLIRALHLSRTDGLIHGFPKHRQIWDLIRCEIRLEIPPLKVRRFSSLSFPILHPGLQTCFEHSLHVPAFRWTVPLSKLSMFELVGVVSTFVIKIYHRRNSSQICSFQQHFAENSFPDTKQFKDLKLAKTSKF